ncbi:MAG TPA: protein kinase, partial [Labilithrix sp.]
VAEAAAGLHAAHELTDAQGRRLNVVHRDVTPHNIFLGYQGSIKVLDFGIAIAADKIARTDVGQFKGKLEYASPEQCRGAELDRRTDVFALGAILWELVTGMRLFKRPTQMEMMRAVVELPIPTPESVVPDLDAEIASAIKKALSRRRRERYQTALELRRDLMRIVHKLAPGIDLEEDLGLVMTRLFQDRLDAKKEMLRLVQAGTAVKELPDAEPDVEVEIPIAVTVEYSSVPPGEGTDTGSDGIPNDTLNQFAPEERPSEPPTMQRAPEDEPPTMQRAPDEPTIEAKPQPPRPAAQKASVPRPVVTKPDEPKKDDVAPALKTNTEPLGFAPKPIEIALAEKKQTEATAAWASPPVGDAVPARATKLTEPLGALAKPDDAEPPPSRPMTTTDPLVVEPPHASARATNARPAARGVPRGLLVGVGIAALLAIVGVAMAVSRMGEQATPSAATSASVDIAPTASASAEPAASEIASAEPAASEIASADPTPATSTDPADDAIVHIETTPSKAVVLVDGAKRGLTPVDVHLAKSKKQVTIELHRAGYQSVKQRVVPDMNQKLILTLVAQQVGAPATSASGKRKFGRFD